MPGIATEQSTRSYLFGCARSNSRIATPCPVDVPRMAVRAKTAPGVHEVTGRRLRRPFRRAPRPVIRGSRDVRHAGGVALVSRPDMPAGGATVDVDAGLQPACLPVPYVEGIAQAFPPPGISPNFGVAPNANRRILPIPCPLFRMIQVRETACARCSISSLRRWIVGANCCRPVTRRARTARSIVASLSFERSCARSIARVPNGLRASRRVPTHCPNGRRL